MITSSPSDSPTVYAWNDEFSSSPGARKCHECLLKPEISFGEALRDVIPNKVHGSVGRQVPSILERSLQVAIPVCVR